MRKIPVGVGIVLTILLWPLFVSSIRAETISGALSRNLFGAANQTFIAVPNPSGGPDLPLLYATPDPQLFKTPLLIGGSFPGSDLIPLGSAITNRISNEVLSESSVVPAP